MMRKAVAGCFVVCLITGLLFAQGLQTAATKDDWEEINFEFNSAILSDGYPSLLRLAEALQKHPDWRIKLEGHTDWVGSDRYNDKLAVARATTVQNFLVKYGASAGQVQVDGRGKRDPKVENKTKEGRFMNRRVTMTVTDGQGRVIAAGGISEVGPTLADLMKKQEECCSQILKQLDKLDDILAALRDLKGENDKLKSDLAALRADQERMRREMESAPKPLTAQQTTEIATQAATGALDEAATRNKKFSLLGLNLGPTMDGGLTFTGKGRFFSPFGGSGTHAVQAEAEYLYFPNRQEGQFDLGLVNRWNRVQAGLFSSFKLVGMRENFIRGSGWLSQGSFTFDVLFNRGRIGLYGTKGLKTESAIARTQLGPSSFNEYFLRISDQLGASAQVGVWKDAYLEGNLGWIRRYSGAGDKPGGLIRLVQPLNDRWAFTAEAGLNETLVGDFEHTSRIAFGFQFGNWVRPKEYLSFDHPVPVDIPRIRYEVLQRRIGNSAPVADAGPDQVGVPPGTIALNGTGSYDPDGDTIQYRWEQVSGGPLSISGMNEAQASFTAEEGQTYSFRLTVTDTGGLKGTDTVVISTTRAPQARILRFNALPNPVQAGQSTTLTWQTENADSIEITGLGPVAASGSANVSPTQTTTYTLTARNRTGEVTEALTVMVDQPNVRIVTFQATPASIVAGEATTLHWATENAASVSIPGVGENLPANGSRAVSPTTSTTYTLVARGPDGREVTAAASVVVTAGQVPRVLSFGASPLQITPGGSSQLCWQVENVTEVMVSGVTGAQPGSACVTVTPSSTTTYTLTARNDQGQVTASTTITVAQRVRITSFSAAPAFSPKAGDPVTLTWTTENANSVVITGTGAPSGSLPVNGSVVVNPTTNTNYTLIAYGPDGSVSAVLHVFVR